MLTQDLRYAFRMLSRRRGFAVAVILTLGVGIGTTTAVFSIADAVLLRPLPYPAAEDIVALTINHAEAGLLRGAASYLEIKDWRERNDVFEDVASFGAGQALSLSGGERPERGGGTFVSPAYFEVLGATPSLGRTFRPEEEEKPGGHPVAILSDGFWRRRFGGDPKVLDSNIVLNGRPYTVVGVLPPEFEDVAFVADVLQPTDVWIPVSMVGVAVHPFYLEDRKGRWMTGVARLKPNLTVEQARAAMQPVAEQLGREHPATNEGHEIDVSTVQDYLSGFGRLRWAVLVLGLAAALLLLIGCANIAILLLMRAMERQREMAIRQAVGAGLPRLVRQLFLESAVLAISGGLIGALVAYLCVNTLVPLNPLPVPGFVHILVDGRALFCASALTLLAGIALGLVPALRGVQQAVRDSLGVGASLPQRSVRALKVLVTGELAVAAIVLVVTGLMVRSFQEFHRTDLGFRSHDVLTMYVDIPRARYETFDDRREFSRRFVSDLKTIAGVDAAHLWSPRLPGWGEPYAWLIPEGTTGENPDELVLAHMNLVTPGSLGQLQVPLLRGREIAETDRDGAPWVTVVSESLADKMWPGDDPLGKRFRRGARGARPLDQVTGYQMGIMLWTSRPAASLTAEVWEVAKRLDPNLPLFEIATLDHKLAERENEPRFYALLMSGFAGVALLLAMLGIYSVMAYWARLRAHELAIRVALGARRRDLLARIAGESIRVTVAGLALGLALAFASSRLLSSQLYGVAANDLSVYVTVLLALGSAAALATYLPARQAADVDPVVVLRAE